MFVRSTKVRSSSGEVHEYVRIVESVRKNGRPAQKVVASLGRRDTLEAVLPMLNRFLKGESEAEAAGLSEEAPVEPLESLTWGPVLVARTLFEELGLGAILEAQDTASSDEDSEATPAPSDWVSRALVLVAAQLLRPSSEHDLATWLESSLVMDRAGRRYIPDWQQNGRVKVSFGQLQQWYRTLDKLFEHKSEIEVALFERLKDLFSLEPDLVFYDITSTYFEGSGPEEAKHGYSRDGKPRNPQVIVGVVMVNGWPIAHHVWAGNRRDSTTVQEVIDDLSHRFDLHRVMFVGDRGMVSARNMEYLENSSFGYLLGKQRRQNPEVERLLSQIRENGWQECPMGINARESKHGWRSWVQEVPSEKPGVRVFVIDSEQRRAYEQAMREKSMARVRESLERIQERVRRGGLRQPEKIGAAVSRALQRHHGHRYYDWRIRDGQLEFFEHPTHLPREKQFEGRFLIETDDSEISPLQAVEQYKQLAEVERGFASLKHPLGLRPIYHQRQHRVEAHIFVAALAFLAERLLEHRLKQARVGLSAREAIKALETVRWVQFRVHEETRDGVTPGDARARGVLDGLGITETRPQTPEEGPFTRM